MTDLGKIRDEIDEVDRNLVKLFTQRMELCRDVAEYKIANGRQVLDAVREKEKLDKIRQIINEDGDDAGFNSRAGEELFKQIMAMSRKLQYRILADHGMISDVSFEMVDEIKKDGVKIVYQGVEGAYAHEAVLQFFGEEADCLHVDTWRDAMEKVSKGEADYAVLPIENSTAGPVTQVHDLLIEYDNYIIAKTDVLVEHALLGLPTATMDDIKTVYSHPQALMQCNAFLDEHSEWRQISYSNTAMGAKKVAAEKDKTAAAIASARAGKLYGLKVLQEKINRLDTNTTRFVIVGRDKIYTKDADKVSICVEINHESGSLYNVLSHFIYNDINMTKIESRPFEDRDWEYRFLIDFEGTLGSAAVKNALRGISEEVNKFAILGNY